MRGNLRGLLLAGAAGLALPATGFGQIATGASSAVDGHLLVAPDAFGSWASATFGGGGDSFNPAGAAGPLEAGFTSGFFLFVGSAQRELLSANATWEGPSGINAVGDATLSRSVITPNAFSDTNGDTVDDQATSAFRVFGGATDLRFDLIQRVSSEGPGIAALRQSYRIQNTGNGPISFSMARVMDADLMWSGDFADDNVGTTTNGSGLGPFVYQSEVGQSAQSVTMSSLVAANYFGGKHGFDPDGAGPGVPYGFGTDVQVWNGFGIPGTWQNNIAGVGNNLNGDSGAAPPGSTAPQDGFMGLGFAFSLNAGESTTFDLFHTFGQTTPVPAPGAMVIPLALGLAALRRRR